MLKSSIETFTVPRVATELSPSGSDSFSFPSLAALASSLSSSVVVGSADSPSSPMPSSSEGSTISSPAGSIVGSASLPCSKDPPSAGLSVTTAGSSPSFVELTSSLLPGAAKSSFTTICFSSFGPSANAALIDVAFHVMSASEMVSKIAMTLPSGVLAPSMMRFSVFSNMSYSPLPAVLRPLSISQSAQLPPRMNSSFHFGNSPGFADSSPSESHINIRETSRHIFAIDEIVGFRDLFVTNDD